MSYKPTIGILGAGQIATAMHIPVLRAMDGVRIAWIGDADISRASEVARANRSRCAALTNDLGDLPACDILLLSIPLLPRRAYFDHYASTKTAILAEKPLAIDAVEHESIVAKFCHWRLSVGYQRRYYATNQLLYSLIRSSIFGALRRVKVAEGGRVTQTRGVGLYQDEAVVRGGGITKNLGCHTLDLALWLTAPSGFHVRERQLAWDCETDRRASATVALFDICGVAGCNCELDWTVSWLDPQPNIFELQFENATIRSSVAPSSQVDVIDRTGNIVSRLTVDTEKGATTSSQAFYLEWADLVESVKLQRESLASAISCSPTARLMDALLSL